MIFYILSEQTRMDFLKVLKNTILDKIADRFSKLSKIGFSVKCFRGDFFQCPKAIAKMFISSGQLGTCF